MATRPIVVGTDFSSASEVAIARASTLATRLRAPLHLIHVVDGTAVGAPRTPLPKEWRTSFVGRAQERGDDFVKFELAERQLEELGESTGADAMLRRFGKAHEELIRAADRAKARLVVVGVRRPRTAVERYLLGSTAERVVRSSRRPVLIVRNRGGGTYGKALVPVDFSDLTPHQFTALHDLMPGIRVSVLHVAPKGASLSPATLAAKAKRMAAKAGFRSGSVSFQFEEGEPREAVLRHEREEKPDLIVVGTHARKGIGRLLLGSVAEHVVRSSSTDVLAVPPLGTAK